jgi:spore germination protein YaaH
MDLRLSRKLICIITALSILSVSSASTMNEKNISKNNTIVSTMNTSTNKDITNTEDYTSAAVINEDKPVDSIVPAEPSVATENSTTSTPDKPLAAVTVKETSTKVLGSKPAITNSSTSTKKPAAPPVVKPSPPPTTKPAELKPVTVAPAVKPVEVAPEVKPAPVTTSISKKLVLGYGTYYYSGDSSSYNSLTKYGSYIDELATHTYSINSSGSLVVTGGGFPTSQVSYANSNGIKTLAAIRNEEGDRFSGALASTILNNPEVKSKLINDILNTVKTKNYKGVNIDFEMLNSKDRDTYTAFVKEVSEKLHKDGYMLTLAVPAKTFDSAKAYWTYAYDYKELGTYADQVVLMTYDEHWQSGTPGPVASIGWVQQVVNYATSVIPKNKLILGLAAYGYDWKISGGYGKSYSVQGAYNTAANNNAEIQWDDTAKVPFFMYTDSTGAERIVYFEDSTSISYKLNIVNNSNLGGVAIWRLGLEDQKYWTTIKDKLNK